MKIRAKDPFTSARLELTGTLTTDHPASSYGQTVMVIDEWDNDCMSHQNWLLAGYYVAEIGDEEIEDFAKWFSLIDLMAAGCRS